MPRHLIEPDVEVVEGSVSGDITSLMNRMTAEEATSTSLTNRMTAAESSISSLTAWRVARADAIADIGNSGMSLSLLGVNVASAASMQGVMNKINAILAALRQREIIVT